MLLHYVWVCTEGAALIPIVHVHSDNERLFIRLPAQLLGGAALVSVLTSSSFKTKKEVVVTVLWRCLNNKPPRLQCGHWMLMPTFTAIFRGSCCALWRSHRYMQAWGSKQTACAFACACVRGGGVRHEAETGVHAQRLPLPHVGGAHESFLPRAVVPRDVVALLLSRGRHEILLTRAAVAASFGAKRETSPSSRRRWWGCRPSGKPVLRLWVSCGDPWSHTGFQQPSSSAAEERDTFHMTQPVTFNSFGIFSQSYESSPTAPLRKVHPRE